MISRSEIKFLSRKDERLKKKKTVQKNYLATLTSPDESQHCVYVYVYAVRAAGAIKTVFPGRRKKAALVVRENPTDICRSPADRRERESPSLHYTYQLSRPRADINFVYCQTSDAFPPAPPPARDPVDNTPSSRSRNLLPPADFRPLPPPPPPPAVSNLPAPRALPPSAVLRTVAGGEGGGEGVFFFAERRTGAGLSSRVLSRKSFSRRGPERPGRFAFAPSLVAETARTASSVYG